MSPDIIAQKYTKFLSLLYKAFCKIMELKFAKILVKL